MHWGFLEHKSRFGAWKKIPNGDDHRPADLLTYIDIFGDQVMSATLCHDTRRVRHDNIKVAIVAKGHKGRVEVEAEPFGLFRDITPAAAMGARGEQETVRGRSGCVPDLRLGFSVSLHARPPDYHQSRGPSPAPAQAREPEPAPPAASPRQPRPALGLNKRFLAQLKAMGAGPSCYPQGQTNSRDKQVERRAATTGGSCAQSIGSTTIRRMGRRGPARPGWSPWGTCSSSASAPLERPAQT